MYGTVARMTAGPDAKQALTEYSKQVMDDPIPGLISTYVYQMDVDPNEYYLAVVFESRESYHANAQSPEQNTRYEQLRALLSADPEWHDGEIIASYTT